jgi:hypothetical protein
MVLMWSLGALDRAVACEPSMTVTIGVRGVLCYDAIKFAWCR